jgi:AraC family transcriptional regulator of adaptative response/methylated-DNA-[protein]-cysteine methyltransferase
VKRAEGDAPSVELPLDIQATAFQRRVWQELQRIPLGATRTYTQVAKALGKPQSVRAVARACATNPVSIVVPCHRVIRTDGQLAGYRWGLQRKEKLLEREAARLNLD